MSDDDSDNGNTIPLCHVLIDMGHSLRLRE